MKLLIHSMFRHLRQHLLQTCFTMAVSILITGMLAVLFHFASSFQHSLRICGLEKYGTYHYRYETKAGTGTARVFTEMGKRFQEDSWFSDVQLAEEGDYVVLTLTVAHPGLFTSKTMWRKFDAVREDCREWMLGEIFYCASDHNWDLLASYGDMEKENGIYAYLMVFLFLLAAVTTASFLTLGSVFWVSAMQREREIALLEGMGAGRGQIIGMILMESAIYSMVSLPVGFCLGIFAYGGIRQHADNIIYSLFRLPPAELVVSLPYSVMLAVCSVCVILLSGLRSAVRVLRISPMEALRRTTEIRLGMGETLDRNALHGRNSWSGGREPSCERWLAQKSWKRFKRRNRPILIMLAVTFSLCFVLDGFRRYSTEVVKMDFDMISYNFSVDLYGDDKVELEGLASEIGSLWVGNLDSSSSPLAIVREAIFKLRSPYPFSEMGEESLLSKGGMLPDVVLQSIDEDSFNRICQELGVVRAADGLWGIFLDTERSWWSKGIMVKGRPYAMEAGERIRFYGMSSGGGEEEFILDIVGVYDRSPLYADVSESGRMQVLVPDVVFSVLEEKRPYRDVEPGIYHISLRGNVEDGQALGMMAKELAEGASSVTCRISDFEEQLRQEKSGIDSFEFLCGALVVTFAFICICGNFTLLWAVNKAREREFAMLLSVGMGPGGLQKMRMFELLYNVRYAFLPGVLVGMCVYQVIYLMYTSEYRISWHFPFAGFLLGTVVLVISVGVVDLALQFWGGKRSLSEQLRMDE